MPDRLDEIAAAARLLLGHVTDFAIIVLDAQGRIQTWNAGARAIKQYEPAEIINQSFTRFYEAEDVAGGKPGRLLAHAAEHGRVEDIGWRVRKDGSRFWGDVVITRLTDVDGTLLGFIKVVRDLTERRAAEDDVRRSEERLRLLIESVTDYAIFMLDADGRVATWNAGAELIKGYRAEEIIGKPISTFYTPEDLQRDHPRQLLELATAYGRIEDEGWRVRKDGSRFWADVIISRLGGGHGFAKVTRDLTSRKQAEDALRRMEESLSATLYSIGDAVIATDERGCVTRLNPVAEQLTGWTQAEAHGKAIDQVFRIVNENTHQPVKSPVDRVLAEGIVVGLANHTALIARDGTECPIADSGAPIRDSAGAICGVVLVFRDVTDERAAERQLARHSAQQEALAQLGLHATGVDDLDDVFAKALELVTAILGTGYAAIFALEAGGVLAVRAARGTEAARHFEVVIPIPGEARPFGVMRTGVGKTGELPPDEASFVQAVATVLASAVARVRTDDRRRAAERAVRDRDVFMSVAAHELRTPLTALQMKLEGLQQLVSKEVGSTVATRFQGALRQTDRLAKLVERLLDVSRIAAGRLVLHLESVELAAIVEDVIRDLKEKASEARVAIDVKVSGDTHGTWDRPRVEQAVVNLVTNALKYGAGKPVRVSLDGGDHAVRLVVADQGIGIANEDVARIFDPFERASSAEHFAGLGLGLHITRSIVVAHGGTIEVESRPGRGATFVVSLPKRREA